MTETAPLRRHAADRQAGRLLVALLAMLLAARLPSAAAAAAQFQADDWTTECEGTASDCSIIVPFRAASTRQAVGSFALAIDVQNGVLAIVGRPPPARATLQVDKNPPLSCTGPRYCLFGAGASLSAVAQLVQGALVLVDVTTAQGSFHASLSTKGFQAGIAKIKAWGYPATTSRHR